VGAARREVLTSIQSPTKTMNSRYERSSSPTNRSAAQGGAGPLKTLRIGRIKATIWENGAEQRTFYNVTFSRTYMDEQKKFHDSDSFGRDDLLVLGKLADQAHTFVCECVAGQKGGETG